MSKRFLLSAILLGLALVVSGFWFSHSLEVSKDLTRGDAWEYVQASYQDDLSLTGKRLFGYPLFLKVHRDLVNMISQTTESPYWLSAALISQLIIFFVSTYVLCRALRMTNLVVPSFVTALALAHPVFAAYSALPMSDVLCTATFSFMIAALVYLFRSKLSSWRAALGLGLSLGVAIVLRPNMPATVVVVLLTIIGVGVLVGRQERWSNGLTAKRVSVSLALVVLAFSPLFIRALYRCSKTYGQACLINPYLGNIGLKISVGYGISSPRWQGAPKMAGVMSTFDPHFEQVNQTCQKAVPFPLEKAPLAWLLRCYLATPLELPLQLLKKVTAAFDNASVNSMAYEQTTPTEADFNRGFALVGFLGFFIGVGAYLRALWRRDAVTLGYLTPAIGFVLIQINFHVENRYFFPVYPVFFVFALGSMCLVLQKPIRQQALFWSGCSVCAAFFFLQTQWWDLQDCASFHAQAAHLQGSERLSRTCPPPDKTTELLRTSARFLP